MLQQDLLDVTNKSRSNLFNWRGQFTPQLVEYLLGAFCRKDSVVLDAFSGSGTVLQEAASLGLEVHSFEINPAAYYMSSFFKLCNMDIEKRRVVFDAIKKLVFPFLIDNGQLFESIDYKDNTSSFELNDYVNLIKGVKLSDIERIVAIDILIKALDFKRKGFRLGCIKAFDFLLEAANALPFSDKIINPYLGDARSVSDLFTEKFDVTITSPPYINVFNYHQNYREVTEALQYDILDIAKSEFGSNRKNRGNRFKTVVQYCLDMESVLQSIVKATVSDGKIIMVVGKESRVRSVPFFNAQLIQDIAEKSNVLEVSHVSNRSFLNKFGETIVEEIIVFDKVGNAEFSSNALHVAKKAIASAITQARNYAPNEVIKELESALESSEHIRPSPRAFTLTV